MAGACDLIATTDTGTGTSVTFSSIPQDYKHLEIQAVEQISGTQSANYMGIRFNGVSSSSYCDDFYSVGGVTALSEAAVSRTFGRLGWTNYSAWRPMKRIIYLPNYSETNVNKMCFGWWLWSDGGNASYGGAGFAGVQIETNDAITSVTLFPETAQAWIANVTQFNLIGWGT